MQDALGTTKLLLEFDLQDQSWSNGLVISSNLQAIFLSA